jgi:hypothetical protein
VEEHVVNFTITFTSQFDKQQDFLIVYELDDETSTSIMLNYFRRKENMFISTKNHVVLILLNKTTFCRESACKIFINNADKRLMKIRLRMANQYFNETKILSVPRTLKVEKQIFLNNDTTKIFNSKS